MTVNHTVDNGPVRVTSSLMVCSEVQQSSYEGNVSDAILPSAPKSGTAPGS